MGSVRRQCLTRHHVEGAPRGIARHVQPPHFAARISRRRDPEQVCRPHLVQRADSRASNIPFIHVLYIILICTIITYTTVPMYASLDEVPPTRYSVPEAD